MHRPFAHHFFVTAELRSTQQYVERGNRARRMQRNAHVVGHRKISEKSDVLKGARDADRVEPGGLHFIDDADFAVFIPKRKLSGSRRIDTADHIEQRRLSRAVRADQTVEPSFTQFA